VTNLKKLLTLVAAILVLVFLFSARDAFADVPRIMNVAVWNDGGNIKLNVTVYHNGETSGHYVDMLNVTLTSGGSLLQSFPQSGPHTLDPSTLTFNVTLDIGQVSDAPLGVVTAHCNLHGWSSQNWTGVVPEYPEQMLIVLFAVVMSVALPAHRIKLSNGRQRSRL
jgi:hypothetical protein